MSPGVRGWERPDSEHFSARVGGGLRVLHFGRCVFCIPSFSLSQHRFQTTSFTPESNCTDYCKNTMKPNKVRNE